MRARKPFVAAYTAPLVAMKGLHYDGVRGCAGCVRVALVNRNFFPFQFQFQYFIRNSFAHTVSLQYHFGLADLGITMAKVTELLTRASWIHLTVHAYS